MPLYEYRCTHCKKETELLQKMDDAPEKTCPHCQKETLKKQISASQFQLKGSGWYVTDFRDKKEKKPDADTPTETKSDDTKTPEKTEKKETSTE